MIYKDHKPSQNLLATPFKFLFRDSDMVTGHIKIKEIKNIEGGFISLKERANMWHSPASMLL